MNGTENSARQSLDPGLRLLAALCLVALTMTPPAFADEAGRLEEPTLNVTLLGTPRPGEVVKVGVHWDGLLPERVFGWLDLDGDGQPTGAEPVLPMSVLDERITVLEIEIPAWVDRLEGVELALVADGAGVGATVPLRKDRGTCGWADEFYINGTNNPVYAMTVFDDGSGPALYVGGWYISTAGHSFVSDVARWNGTSWSQVGSLGGPVRALVVLDDDGAGPNPPVLHAGGDFIGKVRRWNGTSWVSLSFPEPNGNVYCLAVFDDDGAGANPPALYAGGEFTNLGGMYGDYIAKWNGTSWVSLGTGMDGTVRAMTVHNDGPGEALFVGGDLTTAGGLSADHVARWSGSSWSRLGSLSSNGVNNTVLAMTSHHDGSSSALYVGGLFTTAAGAGTVNRVAKWNGSSWSALGSAGSYGVNSTVTALASHNDGSGPALYAGGYFTTAGGAAASYVARWASSSWSAVGAGMDYRVEALASVDMGSGALLYAGGSFSAADGTGATHIAAWNGTSWSALTTGGMGLGDEVHAFAVWDDDPDDQTAPALYVGGNFRAAGEVAASRIARWNGSSWAPLGSGVDSTVRCLAADDSALYAGGYFTSAGGEPADHVASWDGTTWSALGAGLDDFVFALAVWDDDGDGPHEPALYAGGSFVNSGATPVSGIAKWNGSSWSALGAGVVGSVSTMAVYDDGSGEALYVGGQFTTAGGESANYVAKWDGSSWSALPDETTNGLDNVVYSLAVFDDGDGPKLYATGGFTTAAGAGTVYRIARWDGESWSRLDVSTGLNSSGTSLVVFDDGSGPALFIGGYFSTAGGVSVKGITKWDGDTWSALGNGVAGTPVYALAVYDHGAGPGLYAGGYFSRASDYVSGKIAKWWCDCSCSRDLVVNPVPLWAMIGLPCAPSSTVLEDVFGDDLVPGDYDSTWIVFRRDATANTYQVLALADELAIGDGYWIKSLDGDSIDVSGDPTSTICPADSRYSQCFGITLKGVEGGRYNMVSHPFLSPVPWAAARFVDGLGNEYTPSQAQAPGVEIASKVMHLWNGNGYDPYDDSTAGMEGTLEALVGLWVKAYEDVTLRIPTATALASGPLGASTFAPPSKSGSQPAEPGPSEWYVRVIATSGDMQDRGNVLGQLGDSVDGLDQHDLEELPPFQGDYLTVVFPHPEWGSAHGYASDFHAPRPGEKDQWRFEVRTNDPTREVTLSFEGPDEILERAQLMDELTGRVVPLKAHPTYTFVMGSPARAFTWRLHRGP